MSTDLAHRTRGPYAGPPSTEKAKKRRIAISIVSRQMFAPSAILVLLIMAFTLTNPRFATLANIQAILDASAVPTVLAVGLTLIILTGSIDLSVEGVIATVSVASALILHNSVNGNDWGWGAIAIALAIGLAFGSFNGVVYTKLRLPSLIVTLGSWFVGLGIANYLFPESTPAIQDSGFRSLALDQWFGLQKLVYIAVVVVVVAILVLRFTRFGRTLYAIGGAEEMVKLAGVKVDRYKIGAFVAAGLLTAIAALMLTSQLGNGNANAGSNQLFPAISAVVVGGTYLSGGRGGVGQTVLGVLILGVLSNGMILADVTPYVQQAVIGLIIVAAVVAANWRARRPLRIVK